MAQFYHKISSQSHSLTACVTVTVDREKHTKERGWNGGLSQTDERFESNLTTVDPLTGEIIDDFGYHCSTTTNCQGEEIT